MEIFHTNHPMIQLIIMTYNIIIAQLLFLNNQQPLTSGNNDALKMAKRLCLVAY